MRRAEHEKRAEVKPVQRMAKRSFLLFLFIVPALISVVIPSFNMARAAEVTFAWDANSESDLAGYRLYYESETDTEFYQGTDATQGASPITIRCADLADPDSPSFTLTGLDHGKFYYFALTAINSSGMESDFSDEVGTIAEGAESKESGGACFISTTVASGIRPFNFMRRLIALFAR